MILLANNASKRALQVTLCSSSEMKRTAQLASNSRRLKTALARGFSTLEMVVTLTVILLLAAIVSPLLMRSLRVYQLNDSATRLADMLKLTRFEAIRNNTKVSCVFQQTGATWTVWKDSVGNGTLDPVEVRLLLGGYADLLPGAAVPDPAAIAATVGGTAGLSAVSGANGSVRFDSRGAVDYGGGAWVAKVFYIGNAIDATPGYRAVLVLPAGTTQIWAASATGDWRRKS
jgi:type II secretory pathway pseudopilin PulG